MVGEDDGREENGCGVFSMCGGKVSHGPRAVDVDASWPSDGVRGRTDECEQKTVVWTKSSTAVPISVNLKLTLDINVGSLV